MSGSPTLAWRLGEWIESLDVLALPRTVRQANADTVIDTVGLAIAARHTDYMKALCAAWPEEGRCTVLGSMGGRSASAAAMINGTAAHGEDFDNTFEGCPVHPGAVIVPTLLAAAENESLNGADVLRGLAVGQELMCRLGLVAQKGVHAAGFHPTAVIGALGAAAATSAAWRAPAAVTAHALGLAGSMASGIIEYLADGSWTKRMHAGWAAQSGLRAAAMARAGFRGPLSVLEGQHGFFKAFAPSLTPDFTPLTEDLGTHWASARLAFKPYACGTMAQPFIDCALALRAHGIEPRSIVALECTVGEGTVHRLWEPLELKRRPPTAYAAKFSTPYCIAVALVRGSAGLAEFSSDAVNDPQVLAVAERVSYVIDPADEYPRNYSGRIRARLADGTQIETHQPYLRGGAREPLPRQELIAKCRANLRYGDASADFAAAIAELADGLADGMAPLDLDFLRRL